MALLLEERSAWSTHAAWTWVKVGLFGVGLALVVAESLRLTHSTVFRFAAVAALVAAPALQLMTDTLSRLPARQALVRLGAGVALCGALLVVLALTHTDPVEHVTVKRMTGEINVGVAQFSEHGGEGAARSLEASLVDALRRGIHPLVSRVEVRGPKDVPTIGGGTPADRAAGAARTADRLGAHLVVYGDIGYRPDSTTIRPLIYLSESQLVGADELEGEHALGDPIVTNVDIRRNVIGKADIRKQLAARARVLVQLIEALGAYDARDFEQARAIFEEAEGSGALPGSGAKVLALFVGNAALLGGEDGAAAAAYRRALKLDREYARAYLGLAEVTYHRSSARCAEQADQAGLRGSIRLFERAEAASHRPPLALIVPKARFGVGRAHLCLSLAGFVRHRRAAVRNLNDVVAAFERAPKEERGASFRELAALAHGHLGDAAFAFGRGHAGYASAAGEYRRAIKLTRLPRRNAAWSASLVDALARAGRCGDARAELAAALERHPQDARKLRAAASRCR